LQSALEEKSQLDKDLQALQTKYHTAEQEMRKLEQGADNNASKISELEESLRAKEAELSTERDQWNSERNTLQASINTETGKTNTANSVVKEKLDEITSFQKDIQKANADAQPLKDEVGRLTRENTRLDQQVTRIEEENKQLKQQPESLQLEALKTDEKSPLVDPATISGAPPPLAASSTAKSQADQENPTDHSYASP
jgi:chromosome segregation ATPase